LSIKFKKSVEFVVNLFNFEGCQYFEICNTGVDTVPEVTVEK